MNSIQQRVLFHLTGAQELDQVESNTLFTLSQNYPYFAPVQLLLAAKLKAIDAPDFIKQAQKTSIYFSKPFWLHYLLIKKELEKEFEAETKSSILTDLSDSIQIPDTFAKKTKTNLESPIQNYTPFGDSLSANPIAIPTMESVKEILNGIDKHSVTESMIITDPEISIETGNAIELEEIESELTEDQGSYENDAFNDLSNSKISNLLSSHLEAFKKPLEAEDQLEIAKEPMHTVDYFASQGIKIDLSQIPQDKLTTHLRRFTDWLKFMKKSNPDPVDLGTDHDLEKAVEIIANTSNEEKEIVTETMADVLQKQGQLDKAIQLYIKLSFINPEKSAYFASKIQHLKGIQ